MASARVVILEDHPMMRDVLESRLVSHLGDIRIVYSGSSIAEAFVWARGEPVSCIVLDLDLGDGSTFTENLTAVEKLNAPVVVVSASASPKVVQAAMSRGVKAYVSKNSSADEFLQAVDAAIRGSAYVSSDLAGILASNSSGPSLSPQELRALVLYSSGMKIDAVARKMDVSPGTVKEYIKRVRAKYTAAGTPVVTKVELFRAAQEEGLV